MRDKELAWFEVLRDLDRQRLTAQAASDILGSGRRQTFRLLKTYRMRGVDGLIFNQRGRPNNRREPNASAIAGHPSPVATGWAPVLARPVQ